jgi:hypothetical protein
MKKTLWFCLFALLGIRTAWSFDWSLGLFSAQAGAGETAASFSRPQEMRNGDTFALYIKSEDPAYCYVIARDSENNAHVLCNQALVKDQTLVIGPLELTLPSGQEFFYVVMSFTPRRSLEDHIRLFEQNPGSRKAGDDLIGEVLQIRRDISELREKPEMPVPMGGSFRGGDAVPGVRYSGTDCYVKSILIRH